MVWAGGGMPVERTTRALRETLLSEWARTAVSGLPPLLFVLGLGGIYGRDDPYDDEAVKRARSAPGLDANSRFGGAQCAFFGAVLLWEEPQRFAQTRAPQGDTGHCAPAACRAAGNCEFVVGERASQPRPPLPLCAAEAEGRGPR